jgi:RNA polymerase sigma-70 factor (ECF subfamily)
MNAEFEQIVDAHYTALYRFAFSMARNEATAADLTQQTFYLWAAKGHQLRDRSKVKSWLFTTLYREHIGTKRHETRFPHIELNEATEELPEAAEISALEIDGATARAALQQIEEAYRAPLTLFYLQDFSYREIAEVLSIPLGTVMSRLSRGKAELRRLLLDKQEANASKITPFREPKTRQAP